MFLGKPNKHDGFAVDNCTDVRACVVLAYLAPILNAEKPHRIAVRLANTILGAFYGEREVNWGVFVHDLVIKLVGNIGKSRPSPLTPFLYHLYKKEEVLTSREKDDYVTGVVQILQGIVDSEEEPEVGEGTFSNTEG